MAARVLCVRRIRFEFVPLWLCTVAGITWERLLMIMIPSFETGLKSCWSRPINTRLKSRWWTFTMSLGSYLRVPIFTVCMSFSSVTSRRTGQGLIAADWPGLWFMPSKEQKLDFLRCTPR